MSLCKRIECTCGAVAEDASPSANGKDGRPIAPNLGVAKCSEFFREHREHGGLRALSLDDDGVWRWDRPVAARHADPS